MSQHIDSKFTLNLSRLVQEVLTDESRYVYRNDQKLAVLHNKIFSKTEETPMAGLQKIDRDFFNKYFYQGADQFTAIRPETPFADSTEDQNFFFDQLHRQVKLCTYNFDRMDYLRPSYADDKAAEPTFNPDQSAILLRGLIYPLIHSVEQHEISELERKKSGGAKSEEEKSDNPYDQLADKILVQGQSGEFDVIVTYAQLEEIAGQEDQLRKQGLDEPTVVKLLQEYIEKRFPGLQLKLSPTGKINTFLSASGISAGGNLDGKDATKSPSDLPEGKSEGLSFQEVLREMKLRQARKLQYDAIIGSHGNLAFSPLKYQVDPGNGVKIERKGLSADIDQEGQGNIAIFFLVDHQGVSAKVTVDTSIYRTGDKPDFNFSIYSSPSVDLPTNPKIKLGQPDLPKLKTPFLILYRQMLAPSDYEVSPGQPKGILPFQIGGPKATENILGTPLIAEAPEDAGELETPLLAGSLFALMPGGVNGKESQGTPLSLGGPTQGTTFTMPKKPLSPPPITPKKKAPVGLESEDEGDQIPAGMIPKYGTKGKLPAESLEGGTTATQGGGKKGLRKGAIVAAAIGLPIAGVLVSSIANLMMNFPPSS